MKEYIPDDEKGLSEGAFYNRQQKLKSEIYTEIGRRMEKPSALYFIFENEREKEKALELVDKYRQIDSSLAFLKSNFGIDEINSNGIALEFTKNIENHEIIISDFFKRMGLNVRETYKVEKEDTQPSIREKIYNDNVIPFKLKEKPEPTEGIKKKAA